MDTKNYIIKSLFVLLTAFCTTEHINAQNDVVASSTSKIQPKAKVDDRVELLTIMARLADFNEYTKNVLTDYSNDIDKHFLKHKNHPAIVLMKKLREEEGLGYDAVMHMAVLLSPSPELAPRIEFTTEIPDGRWGDTETALKFVGLLQQFYKDSNFEGFFKSHNEFYAVAEERFQKVLDQVDFSWFSSFYGIPTDGIDFHFYIRLQTGGNYGPEVKISDNEKDIYAILSTTETDEKNMPLYSQSRLPVVIHEFSHSFINPIFFENIETFKPSGEVIFEAVQKELQNMGYGNWESIVIESMVRAAVIRYRIDHETDVNEAYDRIITEQNFGFLWTDELVALLGAYAHNRQTYKQFDTFLPVLIGFFEDLKTRVSREVYEFDQRIPHVLHVLPVSDGSNQISPKTNELIVTFDKPIKARESYAIVVKENGNESTSTILDTQLNEDGVSLMIKVKLNPKSEYQFKLSGTKFTTLEGYRMKDYILKFTTSSN